MKRRSHSTNQSLRGSSAPSSIWQDGSPNPEVWNTKLVGTSGAPGNGGVRAGEEHGRRQALRAATQKMKSGCRNEWGQLRVDPGGGTLRDGRLSKRRDTASRAGRGVRPASPSSELHVTLRVPLFPCGQPGTDMIRFPGLPSLPDSAPGDAEPCLLFTAHRTCSVSICRVSK